jgi:hypothetical protein
MGVGASPTNITRFHSARPDDASWNEWRERSSRPDTGGVAKGRLNSSVAFPSRDASVWSATGHTSDACVLSLTDLRIVIGESDAMRTTDIERREMMFSCPHCLEREARELERQALGLSDIAATSNVTGRAVVLLPEANETTR